MLLIKYYVQNTLGCSTDMIEIGSEKFKIFDTQDYTWNTANRKCASEDLIMAEPVDPSVVVKHLEDYYGKYKFVFKINANIFFLKLIVRSFLTNYAKYVPTTLITSVSMGEVPWIKCNKVLTFLYHTPTAPALGQFT